MNVEEKRIHQQQIRDAILEAYKESNTNCTYCLDSYKMKEILIKKLGLEK